MVDGSGRRIELEPDGREIFLLKCCTAVRLGIHVGFLIDRGARDWDYFVTTKLLVEP